MMKVLIVESEFLHQDTWVGNAVERLADALSQQNVTVIKSTSFDDGFAILSLKRRTKNAKAFHDKCENFSFRASNETAVLITAFYSLHGDHLGYG